MSLAATTLTIVGAGPAGLAAGIAGAQAGLDVTVIERAPDLAERPGETLHPGAEVIFRQLGVKATVDRSATLRFPGIMLQETDGVRRRQPFASRPDQTWLGYQIARTKLLDALYRRAVAVGAQVLFGHPAQGLERDRKGRVTALYTAGRWIACDWLIDASGGADWLARREGCGLQVHSPYLTARFGYDRHAVADAWPLLRLHRHGWTWQAALGDGRRAWIQLGRRDQMPPRSQGRGADATWRLAPRPAAVNAYRIGDAACRLDPGAGRGVLRAMMTGIMSVYCIRVAQDGDVAAASEHYADWTAQWFHSDAAELRQLYRRWLTASLHTTQSASTGSS